MSTYSGNPKAERVFQGKMILSIVQQEEFRKAFSVQTISITSRSHWWVGVFVKPESGVLSAGWKPLQKGKSKSKGKQIFAHWGCVWKESLDRFRSMIWCPAGNKQTKLDWPSPAFSCLNLGVKKWIPQCQCSVLYKIVKNRRQRKLKSLYFKLLDFSVYFFSPADEP